MILSNVALALLLLHTPTITARGDGECNRGGRGAGNRGGGGGGGGNRGGGDRSGGDWDHDDWDHGNRNSDGGHRHDDNNNHGGAFRANLSMASDEGIMGAPLVESVRILLTCLENGGGSLHSCRHEINETSACLECEEHAILRAVDEARSERMEHEDRGGDGKRGGGKGEGDDKPPPPPVELIVLAVAAALCGLIGFVCGKRAGRTQAQRLSVLNKGAAELAPPTSAPKGVEDAWTKADPAAATRAFPAVLVLEGKKVDTPRHVEHTPVEPIDGKMTA